MSLQGQCGPGKVKWKLCPSGALWGCGRFLCGLQGPFRKTWSPHTRSSHRGGARDQAAAHCRESWVHPAQWRGRGRVTHLPSTAIDLLRTCGSFSKMTHENDLERLPAQVRGAALEKVPVPERHAGPQHSAAVPMGTPGLPGHQSEERDVPVLGGQLRRAQPECDLPPPSPLSPGTTLPPAQPKCRRERRPGTTR